MGIGKISRGNSKRLYQDGKFYVIEVRQKALAGKKCKFADLALARAFYSLIEF